MSAEAFENHQPTEFRVTFCENCDGGAQEESTAVNTIKQVFPNIPIKTHCLDEYPIEVNIFVKLSNNEERLIWKSHQRNLFRKYPELRDESIRQIVKICKDLINQ